MEISNCDLATAHKHKAVRKVRVKARKKVVNKLSPAEILLAVGSDFQCKYCNMQSCTANSCQRLPFEISLKTCTLKWQLSHLYIEAYTAHAHSQSMLQIPLCKSEMFSSGRILKEIHPHTVPKIRLIYSQK